MTAREKFILAFTTTIAAGGLLTTLILFLKSNKYEPEPPMQPQRTACVAGGYQRGDDRYVIDVFIPGYGVDTAEGIHKETYDLITETLGVC